MVANLTKRAAAALRTLPEDAKLGALESLCAVLPKLARAFARWKERYDHRWLRDVVRAFATGEAKEALSKLDERGRLKLISGHRAMVDALISDWAADKAALPAKTMIAGTRAEVRELNATARALLISAGQVRDSEGLDIEIIHRDETRESKRFAPGDRVVFTKNDKNLGVSNGVAGTILAIEQAAFTPLLRVQLDDANERGETIAMVPPSFGRFDHAYCLTNHKSQGRTFDAAYVLVNPSMADREWSYVAASRSRFSTTLYANLGALVPLDIGSHQPAQAGRDGEVRVALIERLAFGMSRSRRKGTALEWSLTPENRPFIPEPSRAPSSRNPIKPEAARER